MRAAPDVALCHVPRWVPGGDGCQRAAGAGPPTQHGVRTLRARPAARPVAAGAPRRRRRGARFQRYYGDRCPRCDLCTTWRRCGRSVRAPRAGSPSAARPRAPPTGRQRRREPARARRPHRRVGGRVLARPGADGLPTPTATPTPELRIAIVGKYTGLEDSPSRWSTRCGTRRAPAGAAWPSCGWWPTTWSSSTARMTTRHRPAPRRPGARCAAPTAWSCPAGSGFRGSRGSSRASRTRARRSPSWLPRHANHRRGGRGRPGPHASSSEFDPATTHAVVRRLQPGSGAGSRSRPGPHGDATRRTGSTSLTAACASGRTPAVHRPPRLEAVAAVRRRADGGRAAPPVHGRPMGPALRQEGYASWG